MSEDTTTYHAQTESGKLIDLNPWRAAIEGKFYIGFSALGGVHQTGRIVESVCEGVFLAEVETIHGGVDHFFRVVHFQEMLSWRFYADAQTRDNAARNIQQAYEARVAAAAEAEKAKAEEQTITVQQ